MKTPAVVVLEGAGLKSTGMGCAVGKLGEECAAQFPQASVSSWVGREGNGTHQLFCF